MSETRELCKWSEGFGDEVRAVVRGASGPGVRIPFTRPLNDRLDIGSGHFFTDLPVDDDPATTIEQTSVVVKTSPRHRCIRRCRANARGDKAAADGDTEPSDEPPDGDPGAFGPVSDVIDDGVANVVGNPWFTQSSPSFCKGRCVLP